MYELHHVAHQVRRNLETSEIDQNCTNYTLKGGCDDEGDELVRKLAVMSPTTADDTSPGLRSSLREVHGDSHKGAESLKWTQRTR